MKKTVQKYAGSGMCLASSIRSGWSIAQVPPSKSQDYGSGGGFVTSRSENRSYLPLAR